MPSVHGPTSGSTSPIANTGGGSRRDHIAAAMSQQHYQHYAYDAAREAAAAAAAATAAAAASASPKHLQAQVGAGRTASATQSQVSVNGRAWPSEQHVASLSSGQASSSNSSPLQRNGDRSPSNAASGASAPSSTATTSTAATLMPTTAASLMREGPRDFTVIKDVGDGSFGTVCLADWRSPLPSGTLLSPMQHPTTRPEYLGKRLVAIKKMKKPFPNWEECMKLKELKCLLAIPHHPNIIPLYDAFLMPGSKELHFVFECMEGNLYQLTKSRRGRPLASGLVASIFQQIVQGLDHIHEQGYFHRDMKPENLLITTTGLADYPASASLPPSGAPPEKDVLVIVKLADFGLARETNSKPPYTEYVSTRWYRAPEVLLRSRDYSNPVDMWALGTILAELVNLKPLFPGQTEVDQVMQICEVLGDPTRDYGMDGRGRLVGGGEWSRGIRMAKNVGFTFPTAQPITFSSLFNPKVPMALVDCIQDLLRYNPASRLTTQDCLRHSYYIKVAPRLQPASAKAVVAATTPEQQAVHARTVPKASQMASLGSVIDPSAYRTALPPSHSAMPKSASNRPAFGEGARRNNDTKPPSPVDVAMEAASPPHEGSESIQWASAPAGPARDSTISQYPAFPDSASLFTGSHASMHFDENNLRASYAEHSREQQQQQQVHPGYTQQRRMQDDEVEMLHGQERARYAPRVISGSNAQAGPSSSQNYDYDHGNMVYRHGGPSGQAIAHSSPAAKGSTEHDISRSDNIGQSPEGVRERERRRSKGWGINLSSVLGATAPPGQGSLGAGHSQTAFSPPSGGVPSASDPNLRGTATPAQQLAAEHSDRKNAPLPIDPPMDPKKAKKAAEKAAREAEKAKRAAQDKAARERARAVMQKRNQILASSNNTRDQVEWLQVGDSVPPPQVLPPNAVSLYPLSDISRGKLPSFASSSELSPTGLGVGMTSPYSGYPNLGSSSHNSGLPWQPGRSPSHGQMRRLDYDEEMGGGGAAAAGPTSPDPYGFSDPRRQSMQSFQTGDSDPGPNSAYLSGPSGLRTMQRQGSASSLNSAPGLVDGASSIRTRVGTRDSFDTRSIASSLDYQLIQNMQNMTAAEGGAAGGGNLSRHHTGNASPGPAHLVGQRPSLSRQSHGSRASSAHRQGSTSPMHHPMPPRFHPYTSNATGGGGGGNVVVSPTQSTYSFTLPSLATIAQGNANTEYVDNGASMSAGGPHRPRSLPRRSSHSAHRGISRGSSVNSVEPGTLPRLHQGVSSGSSGPVHPMFHVQGAGSQIRGTPPPLPVNGQGQQQQQQQQQPSSGMGSGESSTLASPSQPPLALPPFSQLAAAVEKNSPSAVDEYHAASRSRSHSASQPRHHQPQHQYQHYQHQQHQQQPR